MTTTNSKISHEQVIRKADAELAVLANEEQEALATIRTRMHARAQQFSTLFETASNLQGQYDAIFTQDQLAEGKLAGQLRAAHKEKSKAEKALSSYEATMQREDRADQIKLVALSAEREACTQRLVQ